MISLDQQAQAVQLALLNKRGHHANLSEQFRDGVRGVTEERVRIAGMWLDELEAAHQTLAEMAEKQKGEAA